MKRMANVVLAIVIMVMASNLVAGELLSNVHDFYGEDYPSSIRKHGASTYEKKSFPLVGKVTYKVRVYPVAAQTLLVIRGNKIKTGSRLTVAIRDNGDIKVETLIAGKKLSTEHEAGETFRYLATDIEVGRHFDLLASFVGAKLLPELFEAVGVQKGAKLSYFRYQTWTRYQKPYTYEVRESLHGCVGKSGSGWMTIEVIADSLDWDDQEWSDQYPRWFKIVTHSEGGYAIKFPYDWNLTRLNSDGTLMDLEGRHDPRVHDRLLEDLQEWGFDDTGIEKQPLIKNDIF